MAAVRASYKIEPEVLERFNAAVPAGERSQLIQRLMETALADLERPFEDIAEEFETHPDFAQARADASAFDVAAGDGFHDFK
jgi:hypothetical protein